MYYLLTALTLIPDILVVEIYYRTLFSKRRGSVGVSFWVTAFLFGLLQLAISYYMTGIYSSAKGFIMISVNILFYSCLVLFFHPQKKISIIFAGASFAAINVLCEFLSAIILFLIGMDPNTTSGIIQDAYVSSMTCLLSFITVLIFSHLWKKNISELSIKDIFTVCFTPIISVIILVLFPYQSFINKNAEFEILIILALFILLNVINYYILTNIINQSQIKEELRLSKLQLDYQSNKYLQLSNAYRDTRRIVHEVKRHNAFMLSCIERNEYDKLKDYIDKYGNELESRYVKVNTGNLVIDTFVTNYSSLANDNNIKFNYEIKLDREDIPITDYDLCILLGNLLDNCFNAVSGDNFYISIKIFTKERFFVLYAENPASEDIPNSSRTDNLHHGYGINNMCDITEKYNGLYFQKIEDGIYKTTISIPIFRDSIGTMIPRQGDDNNVTSLL